MISVWLPVPTWLADSDDDDDGGEKNPAGEGHSDRRGLGDDADGGVEEEGEGCAGAVTEAAAAPAAQDGNKKQKKKKKKKGDRDGAEGGVAQQRGSRRKGELVVELDLGLSAAANARAHFAARRQHASKQAKTEAANARALKAAESKVG